MLAGDQPACTASRSSPSNGFTGFLVARRGLPRRHRRRGALRRHGPLRPPPDRARLVRARAARAAAELLRPGRAAARATPRPSTNPFFRLAPEWALDPAGRARHAGHGHRVAGADLGRCSRSPAGRPARLRARASTIVHTSAAAVGQIYIPAINWGLMVGCIGLVLGFRSSDRAGRRLRRRGDRDDGDHHRCSSSWSRASASAGRCPAVARSPAVFLVIDLGVPRRQPLQDPGGRLVPARGRRA